MTLRNAGKSIVSRIVSLRARLNTHRLSRYRSWAYAPYPIALYSSLLGLCTSSRHVCARPFPWSRESGLPDDQSTRDLFIRHDIDTARCASNLPLLVGADQSAGVKTGIYFRADNEEYPIESVCETARQSRDAGHEVGLHTACYVEDDFMARLTREMERFEKALGFRPVSFTVHGLGGYRLDVRGRFIEEALSRLDELGFSFTDCHGSLRRYGYVLHDCHLENDTGRRYLLRDFRSPPSFLPLSDTWLILTHPTYWRD